MSETERHTPLPWRKEGPDMFGDFNILHDGDALAIGAVVTNMRPADEVAANAEFIVRACNAHADLVEALLHAHKELMWAYEQDEYAHGAAGLRLAAQECWAALAKALGDQP